VLVLLSVSVMLAACSGGGVFDGLDAPATPPAGSSFGVQQFGTSADDYSVGVATDVSGNVYVASMDNQSVVVRKYTPNGVLSWVSTPPVGIGFFGTAWRISVSSSAVFVAGSTSAEVDGSGLGMGGILDGFVLRFDLAGVKTGAFQIRNSPGSTDVRGLAADAFGNIYVGGSRNFQESYVAKYNWSGVSPSPLWTTRYGASGDRSAVYGLALGNGFVHAVGPSGSSNFYVVRFSALDGSQIGTTITDNASGGTISVFSVAADSANNTYVTGGTDNDFAGTNAGGVDIIAAKYDAAGGNAWRYQVGSAKDENANSIALSGSSVYLSGTTLGQFGGQSNKDPGLSTSDVFLVKLPAFPSGATVTPDWVRMYGGSVAGPSYAVEDWSGGVATDASGNVFMTGRTQGLVQSATEIFGGWDLFLMEISASGDLQI